MRQVRSLLASVPMFITQTLGQDVVVEIPTQGDHVQQLFDGCAQTWMVTSQMPYTVQIMFDACNLQVHVHAMRGNFDHMGNTRLSIPHQGVVSPPPMPAPPQP